MSDKTIFPSFSWKTDLKRAAKIDYFDDFFELLAEQLYLDEVLAGECNPKAFLKAQIIDTIDTLNIRSQEKRLEETKRRLSK